MHRSIAFFILAAFTTMLGGHASAQSEAFSGKVDWEGYTYAKTKRAGFELRRDVHESIVSGDCKSLDDWAAYARARIKIEAHNGNTLGSSMRDYVDYYLEELDCVLPDGEIKVSVPGKIPHDYVQQGK